VINYISEEPGIYKLVFSNEHSWVRGKSLMYRYSVLRPTTKELEKIAIRERDEKMRA